MSKINKNRMLDMSYIISWHIYNFIQIYNILWYNLYHLYPVIFRIWFLKSVHKNLKLKCVRWVSAFRIFLLYLLLLEKEKSIQNPSGGFASKLGRGESSLLTQPHVFHFHSKIFPNVQNYSTCAWSFCFCMLLCLRFRVSF